MWRRTYLILFFIRLYFALSPSYLHPDEIFQGPEIIAGSVFGFPSRKTWEWTSSAPLRSVFPLWPVYGLPMVLLQWLGPGDADGNVSPATVYYTLRFVMFLMSFVLEDWAIHELVQSRRYRRRAVVLVASSYVTWTFQTHTFSNSVETLLVLWSLVVIERIVGEQKSSSIRPSLVLGFLLVFGTFNRITFPAFIILPGARLLPHYWNRPLSLTAIVLSIMFWTWIAIATDTVYYTGPEASDSLRALLTYVSTRPVITPINNVLYNSQTSNLAEHGLHPHYQHVVANLPQLLGPALPALLFSTLYPFTMSNLKAKLSNPRLLSAASSIFILSIFPHQEPRFLLPCVPLLLTCFDIPSGSCSFPLSLSSSSPASSSGPSSPSSPSFSAGRQLSLTNVFWTSWIIFNLLLGTLMGVYHQAGIIPSVLALPSLIPPSLSASKSRASNIEVFYWKTYPPPTFLLGNSSDSSSGDSDSDASSRARNPLTGQTLNISMVPLMGLPQSEVVFMLMQHFATCDPGLVDYISPHVEPTEVFLAAPLSAWRLPFSISSDDVEPGTTATATTTNATTPPPPEQHEQPQHEQLLDPANPGFIIHFAKQGVSLGMRSLHVWRSHVNLDDLDVGDDGLGPTLQRVWGRRGLAVWKVERMCPPRG